MDIVQLRYFSTVARTGSVRRAAELLRLSPAAVSKALHLLEEELGQRLVARSGRNIIITDYGVRFAERVKPMLSQFEELQREIEAPKVPEKLRICTFEVFSTYFLEALSLLPWDGRPFTLYDVIPGELERAIVERTADLGITYMPVPHPDLDFLKICQIEMGVFAKRRAFPNLKQEEFPFVVPAMPVQGAPSRVRGLDGWPENAYHRKVLYEVTLMESALELCRQGRCAGYFPTFVVEAHNKRVMTHYQLDRIASPYSGRKCFTDVYVVKRKSDDESLEAKQLAKAIRLFCK